MSIPTSITVVDTRMSSLPVVEGLHDLVLLRTLHPSVDETDAKLREDILLKVLGHPGGILEIKGLRFRNEGVDDEDLVSLDDLLPDDFVDPGPFLSRRRSSS